MRKLHKNKRLRFDVFGTQMVIERRNEQWLLFNVSNHGLLTRITDVAIPAELTDSELITYLDDIFHEKATLENAAVKPLD
jgi:hypothetical protein